MAINLRNVPEGFLSAQKLLKRSPRAREVNNAIKRLNPRDAPHIPSSSSLKEGTQKGRKHLGKTQELYYRGPYLQPTSLDIKTYIEKFSDTYKSRKNSVTQLLQMSTHGQSYSSPPFPLPAFFQQVLKQIPDSTIF